MLAIEGARDSAKGSEQLAFKYSTRNLE